MWCFVFPTIDTEWCCIHRYLNTCWPIRVHLSIFMMETLQLEFKIRPVNTSLYIKAPHRNTDTHSYIIQTEAILQSSRTHNPSPSWQYFMAKSNRMTSWHDWLDGWMEILVFRKKVALIPTGFEQLISYSNRNILHAFLQLPSHFGMAHCVQFSSISMLNYTQNGGHINF